MFLFWQQAKNHRLIEGRCGIMFTADEKYNKKGKANPNAINHKTLDSVVREHAKNVSMMIHVDWNPRIPFGK